MLSFNQLLLIVVVLTIITAIFLTSEWRHRPEEHPSSLDSQYSPNQNVSDSPNPDFSALIKSIREEGHAYRKEEYREDDRKIVVDFINTLFLILTFCVLSYTCWAIIQQVDEMKRVYPEIQKQAVATDRQLDLIKQEGQAWVGPIGMVLVDPKSSDEPLKARLSYRNFGRQPAAHFYSVATARLPLLGAATQADIARLPFWKDKAQFDPDSVCGSEQYKIGESTVYPSDLAFTIDVGVRNGSPVTNDYTATGVGTPTSVVLSDVVNKSRLYVIFGCFTYTTFDETAFSMWCNMLVPTVGTDISKWPFVFCPFGNENKMKKK